MDGKPPCVISASNTPETSRLFPYSLQKLPFFSRPKVYTIVDCTYSYIMDLAVLAAAALSSAQSTLPIPQPALLAREPDVSNTGKPPVEREVCPHCSNLQLSKLKKPAFMILYFESMYKSAGNCTYCNVISEGIFVENFTRHGRIKQFCFSTSPAGSLEASQVSPYDLPTLYPLRYLSQHLKDTNIYSNVSRSKRKFAPTYP